MARKRHYKKVDVSTLSATEKKAYKKRLAYVRKYTQDKREWEKKVKNGELHAGFTLDQYRGVKHGHSKAEVSRKVVHKLKGHSEALLGKLKRLVIEIERSEKKKQELEEILKNIGI